MVVFPNCKINLGLHITRKREDGYHDLETVFYPVQVQDVLEVVKQQVVNGEKPVEGNPVGLHMSGLKVNGDPDDNLCVKAYHLLKKDFPHIPAIELYLHKAIPMGAGLGGGSSDGAFTLQLLNEKFQLGISRDKLLQYSLQLGSDCPFFIINQPCFAAGRGEVLQPVTCDLQNYSLLLVHPGIHINTGWAFSQLTPAPAAQSIKHIVQQPVGAWKNTLINDFEAPVCSLHPELKTIKEKLYAAGALYASMTGSGSTFYGIFAKGGQPTIDWPATYHVFHC